MQTLSERKLSGCLETRGVGMGGRDNKGAKGNFEGVMQFVHYFHRGDVFRVVGKR